MNPVIDNCFVCSPRNTSGLRLQFVVTGDECVAEFTVDACFDGYRGVTHGGIQAAILDDAMANIFYKSGLPAFTVEMQLRYHRPMYSGRQYRVEAGVTENRGSRIRRTRACIRDLASGEVVTEATGTFLIGQGLLKTVRSVAAENERKEEAEADQTDAGAGTAGKVPRAQAHSSR